MPGGSSPRKAGSLNYKDISAAWKVAAGDEPKDPHTAGFWSPVLQGAGALRAFLPVPLWAELL